MNIKGKIQNGGALWQLLHLPGGSKDHNLVKKIIVQLLITVGGVVVKHLPYILQPIVKASLCLYALISPVGGISALCNKVHTLCPYLHLYCNPLSVVNGNMKGLVTVGFWSGEPIPQSLYIRLILPCNIRIDIPAVVLLLLKRGVNYESYGKEVIDPLKWNSLFNHLLPDGVGGLGSDFKLIGILLLKHIVQRFHKLLCQPLPLLSGGKKLVGNEPVVLRV